MIDSFHPAVSTWFAESFPEGPTEPQADGWPAIASGADTLVSAPTGSGKTLAGFLVAIDQLYQAHARGVEIAGAIRVVYVSPLKALAVDVEQNLRRPLGGIAKQARLLGMDPAPITVAVRTGDTPSSVRSAMVKDPPTILATTPESLYLLLGAERSRQVLRQVQAVIVDEIHALVRDKRGSHLSLTLARLDHVQHGPRPQRIGLSATQRPVERVAAFLSGASYSGGRRSKEGSAGATTIVDRGHRRELRLLIELPGSELEAVASAQQMGEVIDRIAELVLERRTTLVFVNTRRMAERLAHQIGQRLEELGVEADQIAAHHGSLSKQRRQRVEARLKAGELRALVATSSLELGIDIGPVELVCQIGSPRAISTFLQRVGRSNHSRDGVPDGRLFPLSRDELVESVALLGAVRDGKLDAVVAPVAPLDILAQQIVAEVAAEGKWVEDDLFDLFRSADPYRELSRADFDAVVDLLAEGIVTGRGRRGAWLHRDQVNGILRPRRGARLAAVTSGGAIPEVGDYKVVLDPDEATIGAVNEDFAIESMVGDVFLLGTHPWRIRRVEPGVVRVVDAEGATPNVPFWVGEAPSRSAELSVEVSRLRCGVAKKLGSGTDAARAWVCEHYGVSQAVAAGVVSYLAVAKTQLGSLPTHDELVLERFFDEAGGMQLVVHAPFGGRLNRALGLALRKRFCATFDFELQAAANDDAVLLSLGPQHSFPLETVPQLLHPDTVRDVLTQAVLTSPMFGARWRWNLNRSLVVLRFRGGRKNPLPIQRMEADDLMAAVFPALAACQENAAAGPIAVPDHLLVRQALHDCLHEAMDVDALVEVVGALRNKKLRVRFVDTTAPSVLSHEILNARPYAFLDDAPLEERRSRAVGVRRGLPLEPGALSHLDPEAIERVREEARANPGSAEELHDLLLLCTVHRPIPLARSWFDALFAAGRVGEVHLPQDDARCEADSEQPEVLWYPTEHRGRVEDLFRGALLIPATLDRRPKGTKIHGSPLDADELDPDQVVADVLRGHLDHLGPVTEEELSWRTGLAPSRVSVGLARLEAEGFVIQGHFESASPAAPGVALPKAGNGALSPLQWCSRRLLHRIHSYARNSRRSSVELVSAQVYMRFLLRWQHVEPGWQRQGRDGVLAVVDQLQGFEVAAGAWEESVLASRVEGYEGTWLEDLCLSGELTWGRLSLRAAPGDGATGRGASVPSKATPLALARRRDLPWLLRALRGKAAPVDPPHGPARDVLDALRIHGALFHGELGSLAKRLPAEVEEGLWDLVARGLVTADSFQAVRSLLGARERARRATRRRARDAWSPGGKRSGSALRHAGSGRRWGSEEKAFGWPRASWGSPRRSEGRWALLPAPDKDADADSLAEAVAEQLLARWGVLFFEVVARENIALPWREVIWALRRLEARGVVRAGRFVSGFAGEQYALFDAADQLQAMSHLEPTGQVVTVSGSDPLNLVGIIVPGPRVPAIGGNRVAYRDGLVHALGVRGAKAGPLSVSSPNGRRVGEGSLRSPG